MHADYRGALLDVRQGVANWRMWTRLAWSDVRMRYRRTLLGPFWATLSLGVMIFVMSVVMARLFNADLKQFLPYVTSGMVTWTLLSGLVTEGTSVFISAEPLIKSLRIPLTTLVCAAAWRNIILFGHNLAIYVLVMVVMSVPVTLSTLLVFPALFLYALNAIWVGILLGIFAARFRDISPVVVAFVQVVVFVTPIFWNADQIKGRLGILLSDYNVFNHFVQIVRGPLLGNTPQLLSWAVVLGVTLVGWGVSLAMFSRYRQRIAYWV